VTLIAGRDGGRPRAQPEKSNADPLEKLRQPALSILIVDDAVDLREMYKAYFEFRGVRVTTAEDGAEATNLVMLDPPDVIILDLAMPRMTGLDVLRTLRTNQWTKGIPVVVLSGRQSEDEAIAAGASAYLEKPCLPQPLLREAVRVLREPGRRAEEH
jgi:two-component system, cell cycle response regulator DivK